MTTSYFTNPIDFLITTLVGMYVMVIMLRVLLQWGRGDFYNPISQFIVKVTNPPLVPLRRFIPGFAGIDIAAVVLMLLIQVAAFSFLIIIHGGVPGVGVLFLALHEIVELLFNVFFFGILIQVILSWVAPHTYHPAISILNTITEPVLGPARRIFKPISGIDLSPIVAIIALQLAKMIILPPLLMLAR